MGLSSSLTQILSEWLVSRDRHVGQLFLSLPFPCQELFPVFFGPKGVNNVSMGQEERVLLLTSKERTSLALASSVKVCRHSQVFISD